MRIDFYTKFVLTVIALCLLWMSLGGTALLPTVQARTGPERVVIAGWVDRLGSINEFAPGVNVPEVSRGIPVSVVSGGR